MINIDVPGYGSYEIRNLVLDYNGTLAEDGRLIDGVRELIQELSEVVEIYVITADTFGTVEYELKDSPARIYKIKHENEKQEKLDLVRRIDPKETISIGNGNNDVLILQESAIGICVLGSEGCSRKAMESSDIISSDIRLAMGLLKDPNRLKATLRF